jgi:hypothetical protein
MAGPDFMNGFRLGLVWQRLMSGERDFDAVVPAGSIDICRMMARGLGLRVSFDFGVGTAVATFSAGPAPGRPALTVIPGGTVMFGPDFDRAVRIWILVVLAIAFLGGVLAAEAVRWLHDLLAWRPS